MQKTREWVLANEEQSSKQIHGKIFLTVIEDAFKNAN